MTRASPTEPPATDPVVVASTKDKPRPRKHKEDRHQQTGGQKMVSAKDSQNYTDTTLHNKPQATTANNIHDQDQDQPIHESVNSSNLVMLQRNGLIERARSRQQQQTINSFLVTGDPSVATKLHNSDFTPEANPNEYTRSILRANQGRLQLQKQQQQKHMLHNDGYDNCDRNYYHHSNDDNHHPDGHGSDQNLNINEDYRAGCINEDYDDDDDEDSSSSRTELLSDAILTVASAEEYAAKIIKLQQACLTPLKEDLAEWLNKILNTSEITTENFMNRLDNGVIICRLAKIISQCCAQRLTEKETPSIGKEDQQSLDDVQQSTSQRQLLDSSMKQPLELSSNYNVCGALSVMEKNHCPTAAQQLLTPLQNCGQTLVTSVETTQTTPITLPSANGSRATLSTTSKQAQQTPLLASRASRQQPSNRPQTMTRPIEGPTNSAASATASVLVSGVLSGDACSTPFRSSHTLASSLSCTPISQSTNCIVSSGSTAMTTATTPFMNCHEGNNGSTISISSQQQASRATMCSSSSIVSAAGPTTYQCTTTTFPMNYHGTNQFLNNLIRMDQTKIWEDAKCRTFYARDNVCNFIEWSKEFGVNQSVLFESDDLVLHANPRQVVLCLLDVARIAYVKFGFTEAPGLVKFEQEIDRKLAAERAIAELESGEVTEIMDTNRLEKAALCSREIHLFKDAQVPNAYKSSSRERSSDTGVFDATRLAETKKPRRGLSLATDATDELIMRYCRHKEEEAARRKSEEIQAATTAAATAAADADADVAEGEAEAAMFPRAIGNLHDEKLHEPAVNQAAAATGPIVTEPSQGSIQASAREEYCADSLSERSGFKEADNDSLPNKMINDAMGRETDNFQLDSLIDDDHREYSSVVENPLTPSTIAAKGQTTVAICDEESQNRLADTANLFATNRTDSLDSGGEGPGESSSTGRGSSHTPSASGSSSTASKQPDYSSEDIITSTTDLTRSATNTPVPAKRSHFSPLDAISTVPHSELSSSRSSLLSMGQDNRLDTPTGSSGRQITSDLDGKVMRIAKSYYGKGVSKGVTRLSEGKYRIADRIVFVRLLKGHRVMVRIGGGWDTLENFLFRHKSDPSQVIDVDNLLPIGTKMAFDKSLNPLHNSNNKSISKLPRYGRSNSTSSTNLSISNRSYSDHSLTNGINRAKPLLTATSTIDTSSHTTTGSTSSGPTPTHNNKSSLNTKSPYFLIHRGHKSRT